MTCFVSNLQVRWRLCELINAIVFYNVLLHASKGGIILMRYSYLITNILILIHRKYFDEKNVCEFKTAN